MENKSTQELIKFHDEIVHFWKEWFSGDPEVKLDIFVERLFEEIIGRKPRKDEAITFIYKLGDR